jgi:hypothetical protein
MQKVDMQAVKLSIDILALLFYFRALPPPFDEFNLKKRNEGARTFDECRDCSMTA